MRRAPSQRNDRTSADDSSGYFSSNANGPFITPMIAELGEGALDARAMLDRQAAHTDIERLAQKHQPRGKKTDRMTVST
jgi:hypothetical protein